MSKNQLHFWETVLGLARATRTARKVDLDTAADALELEQLAVSKIQQISVTVPFAPQPLLAAAEESPSYGTSKPGQH